MSEPTTAAAPATPETEEPGVVTLGAEKFMREASGKLVPLSLVKPVDKLMDQLVRRMMAFAEDLSAQVGRFKGHAFDDVGAFEALIAEAYQASVGGAKGNVTLSTVDGCRKVQIQVQDQISFGPELQAAKSLVDECVVGWSEGSQPEIRALVEHAFQVDREGRINRAALFQLRRVAIEDERWKRAMDAITDSIRILGSKTYMRFYRRETPRARWEPVTIDLAAA